MLKILVYPKDKNPYQNLLYKHLSTEVFLKYLTNPTSSHVLGLILLPFQVTKFRLQGFRVFHLHWFYTFQLTHQNPIFHSKPFKVIFSIYFLFFVLLLKTLRYKLVWTVHDVLPHGEQFINNKLVVRVLGIFANVKIVHSSSTLNEMKTLKISTINANIIPIGNYIDVYPNTITKLDAKDKLKLKKDSFVFGFFGRIEFYKGVLELIDAFLELNEQNSYLLISGPCFNKELAERIRACSLSNPSILFYEQFVPDDRVQIFLNASDVHVYPFTRITTSSSVMLAMSFKKTVICPLLGEMKDIPLNVGLFYDCDDRTKLVELMKYSVDNKEEIIKKGNEAYSFASTRNWINITNLTIELYKSL